MPATTDEADLGPVKVFVGQVPKSISEEGLFLTFSVYGPIKELLVIRDKYTGQHRGCAFVTFWFPTAALKFKKNSTINLCFQMEASPFKFDRPRNRPRTYMFTTPSKKINFL